MFGFKKDEVVVRGVDEKYVKQVIEIGVKKSAIETQMKMLTNQIVDLEIKQRRMWEEIKEEYQLHDNENYSFDSDKAEINRKG